jgi:hypothetical protein
MNKSTIFPNRRQKVGKVGKKSDFLTSKHFAMFNFSKLVRGYPAIQGVK